MGTVSDQILCELLECGEADLEKFEGCAYDMSDVVEAVREGNESPTFHGIHPTRICEYAGSFIQLTTEEV